MLLYILHHACSFLQVPGYVVLLQCIGEFWPVLERVF